MNINDFEKEWTALGVEICHAIYKNPRVKELSAGLKKNGFLTLEEKSDFINISDKTKYEIEE